MKCTVFALSAITGLAFAAAPIPRPVNVCPGDQAYLIQDPPPQGFRCLEPVKPIGTYARRARIQSFTTDFYGCNKECFINPNCKAQLFEPLNDGSGNGKCTTYNAGGGMRDGRLMRGDPNAQFSSKQCLYTPSCLQIQAKSAANAPGYVGQYWSTQRLNGIDTVVLDDTPQFYYFNIQGAFISDSNGYDSQAAYPPIVPIGTPGVQIPITFPDAATQNSGNYQFTGVSCGYDPTADEFTCGSQAGGVFIACTNDNVVKQAKDETAGQLPGCSVVKFTLIR